MVNTRVLGKLTKYFNPLVGIGLVLLLCTAVPAQAQFFFPSTQVLKDSGVKTIRVYRQPLKYIGSTEEERQKMGQPDTTRSLYEVYHLNRYGKADSVITYQRYVYTYDQDEIVGYTIYSSNGNIYQRAEITKTELHERISKGWQYEKLTSSSRINADGILVEQLYFYNNDTSWRYATRFDPETNIKTEHRRGEKGAYAIETYQWFTENGEPSSFQHRLEEREAGKSNIHTKEKTYPLDSAGNVVNKYLGRFDDPYLQYNFYERYDTFRPVQFYSEERFREDQLITEKINEELYTFSGIELVVRYTLEYEFR